VASTNSSENLKSKEILDAPNDTFSETEDPEDTTLREKIKTTSKWDNRKNMENLRSLKSPCIPLFQRGI
jgi:hypothetical protein